MVFSWVPPPLQSLLPKAEDLDMTGLDISAEDVAELLNVDAAAFSNELEDLDQYMSKVGDRLPERMKAQIEAYKVCLK